MRDTSGKYGKKQVKVEQLQPGMHLFSPTHRTGVLSAIAGYFDSRKRRTIKQGSLAQVDNRKAITE
jgi:hypothetical protein